MTARVVLSDLREAAGLTQRQVAIKTGLTEKTIWLAEQQQHLASIRTLTRFAELYDVAMDDLVDKEYHLGHDTEHRP